MTITNKGRAMHASITIKLLKFELYKTESLIKDVPSEEIIKSSLFNEE